ncbi:hypothetical protein DESC_610083 [Desulfosarcina cetonica]|nr:hypothetical protein DESC_610083 [Desulfosarcina cetonica]
MVPFPGTISLEIRNAGQGLKKIVVGGKREKRFIIAHRSLRDPTGHDNITFQHPANQRGEKRTCVLKHFRITTRTTMPTVTAAAISTNTA